MEEETVMVQVQGVGKRYRLGTTNRQQLTDDVKAWTAKLLRRPDPTIPIGTEVDPQRIGEDFWALRDVSFEVRRGEVVGIIGHNGAGKSTMLKLLSRITLPTEGAIRMRGKVSSLLEVGTGFHPELSGRDNIYLNGAILGMRKAEVSAKLEEIIVFSGIRHHIDTPVKRYSSGMRVRLGFAVAAHLEPEILIVDEVLSVGDAEFQRKSMGKMKDSAASGRTVLFVSHNMTAMRSLCQRVIWLEHGRIRLIGPAQEVVDAYLAEYSDDRTEMIWDDPATAPGTDQVRLRAVAVRSPSTDGLFRWEHPVDVSISLENVGIADGDLNVNIQLISRDEHIVLATNLEEGIPEAKWNIGTHQLELRIPSKLLNAGGYSINVAVSRHNKQLFRMDKPVSFVMQEPPRTRSYMGKRRGILNLPIQWNHNVGSSPSRISNS